VARSYSGGHRAAAPWWCVFALVVFVWLGGGGVSAHADVIYRLLPAVGVGVTDNAATTATGGPQQADGLVMASVAGSARYARALSIHRLDASVVYTRYILNRGPAALTALLAWMSSFKLSSSVDLSLGATGTVSRMSSIVAVTDITATTPSAYATPDSYYGTGTVSQGLTFTPTPRQVYAETLAFSQARTLGSTTTSVPTTNAITGKLSAGWITPRDPKINPNPELVWGGFNPPRDGFFVEPMVTDAFTTGATTTTATTAIPTNGQVVSADVVVRWQHEIGVTWTSQLAAGPLAIFQTGRATAYNFMALASLAYHELPWFASLSVDQTPIPNLYLGAVTLNDEALARAAVPLTRNQLIFLGGFGGYVYARLSDVNGNFYHAFDLRTAGASLTSRFRDRPFALSLVYTLTDQHAVSPPPGAVPGATPPSIERQTLMLTLTGVFSWGPGTLPLFRGGLEGGGV
jgi:hypothetical protein